MRHLLLIISILSMIVANAQRKQTGDTPFKPVFPEAVIQENSKSSLTVKNNTDHDIIVVLRGQETQYLRHIYIRNSDKFTFSNLPHTRFYVQFKAQEFHYEDLSREISRYGTQHTFEFFYDPAQMSNYKKITAEEFFKN